MILKEKPKISVLPCISSKTLVFVSTYQKQHAPCKKKTYWWTDLNWWCYFCVVRVWEEKWLLRWKQKNMKKKHLTPTEKPIFKDTVLFYISKVVQICLILDLATDLKSSQCVFFHQSSSSLKLTSKFDQKPFYDQKTDTTVALVSCSEERAELKGKALSLLVCLCSNPHRLSWGLDHDRKKEITSGWNEIDL